MASVYFGQAILWVAVDHPLPVSRRRGLELLTKLAIPYSSTLSLALNLALTDLLFKDNEIKLEGDEFIHRSTRLSHALLCATKVDGKDDALKDQLMVDFLLITHSPQLGKNTVCFRLPGISQILIAKSSGNVWIDIVQQAQMDPRELIVRNLDAILQMIEASLDKSAQVGNLPYHCLLLTLCPVKSASWSCLASYHNHSVCSTRRVSTEAFRTDQSLP